MLAVAGLEGTRLDGILLCLFAFKVVSFVEFERIAVKQFGAGPGGGQVHYCRVVC